MQLTYLNAVLSGRYVPVERPTVSVRSLHNNFLINRHNERINTFLGLDIADASRRNFTRLRCQLRAGAAYLQSCIVNGAVLSQQEQMAYTRMLSCQEIQLFEFITTNLTLKHATKCFDFLNGSQPMLSLKERERRQMPIQNRHTWTQYGVDDSIYFVLGIGDHQTPPFPVPYQSAPLSFRLFGLLIIR